MITTNKSEQIRFRCTKTEKRIIYNLSKKCGMTISEYCRKQARHGEVLAIPKLSDVEIEYLHSLKSYSSHFNRISNLIKEKDPALTDEIKILVEQFTLLQKRLIG